MARSPWLAPLTILLVCVMFLTGCISAAPRRFDDGSVAVGHVDKDHPGDAQKAGGHDAVAVLFFLGCVVIVGVVIADLIILPYTISVDEPFYCTHEVVHCCFH